MLNSAQVGPADIFVELDSLVVGDTKPRFRKDAGIEREDWSALRWRSPVRRRDQEKLSLPVQLS